MAEKESIIKYITPEQAGVPAENIEKFVRILEENNLATHSVIFARGNNIFFENYWKPFDSEFLHRMYSVTKSFVSLAVGFAEQDGLLDLDDKMSKYFAKELAGNPDQNVWNQTVRHMLMMSTAKPPYGWFCHRPEDRVQHYFSNPNPYTRPSGTLYEYDSEGSFVLGSLVERLTGKPIMEYLREKLFRKIGVSEEAYMLKCPGGHSWSDSALLCRPMDLFLTARFVLNGGKWNGEQILNEEYVRTATSKLIDNNYQGSNTFDSQGYGYLFWRTYQDSFFFNGMGWQYAVCVPEQDMIMVYNADNQGKDGVKRILFDKFYELIVNAAKDEPLPENLKANESLQSYVKDLELMKAKGSKESSWMEKVNGVTYTLQENPMGISRICLTFENGKGCFAYTNAQGDKKLWFGLGYNEFGEFPQEGYAAEVGSVFTPGNYYKCAVSAGWIEEHKLRIVVQIIDRYFGNMTITLGFREDMVGVFMVKTAEDFLDEYVGYASGKHAYCKQE